MKKYSYITLLVLIVFFSCNKEDLKYQSNESTEDSLSSYFTLANDFKLPIKKRQEYNQKAFLIVANQDNDSMNRVNFFKVANRFYNTNNWKSFSTTVQQVLKNAEESKDTLSIVKAYTYLGDYYKTQFKSDSAFLYYFRAEKIYLGRKDGYNLARTRLNKAMLQFNENDFSGSEISVFKALSAIKGSVHKDILYDAYNLLGVIYNELGEYSKSIEFLNKALANIDDATMPIEFQSRATTLNNLGYVYQIQKKHKQAIAYFQEGLKDKKGLLLYKPVVYAMLIDNLGLSRLKTNDFRGLPELFYESLKLRDSLNFRSGILSSQIELSEYYAVKKDAKKALEFSHLALSTARESKNARNILVALKQMALVEPKKAIAYNKEYIHINDSLQKANRNIADKFARIEYETDQIIEENSALTEQNRNLVYIFGSILILGMFLYIIKAQKVKNRELLYKQERQNANEEIYNLMISQQSEVEVIRVKEKKRVAQELHDGVLGRMFGVRMNLDGLNNFQDESAIKERISYLNELKNIEQDIREISHDLNREKSELINNFVAIVDNLFEEQKKTFHSTLFLTIDNTINWEVMSNGNKINLFRIVQESLQNINKYAKASTIKVVFKKELDVLYLQISDDGIGFNVNKVKKGIGLQNMVSRINECNGTFEIKSKTGEGTIITVTVPV